MSTEEVRRSKADELSVVRQPLARRDQAEKIAGTTRYAGDVVLPRMLRAGLVRSPVPSALITGRSAAEALKVPGVVAVLFGEDVPHNEIWVDVPGQLIEVAPLKANMEILATERVRFQGEPVALVIAETEESLTEASELVEIDYEDLPGVFDPARALAEGAPRVHAQGNLLARWDIDSGDIDAAFAGADLVVEETYQT